MLHINERIYWHFQVYTLYLCTTFSKQVLTESYTCSGPLKTGIEYQIMDLSKVSTESHTHRGPVKTGIN